MTPRERRDRIREARRLRAVLRGQVAELAAKFQLLRQASEAGTLDPDTVAERARVMQQDLERLEREITVLEDRTRSLEQEPSGNS